MLAAIFIQLASPDLDKIWLDPNLKGAIVGACVMDTSGKELYAHNAELLMVPASNQKLVTAAIALKALGPDFRPTTKFWRAGHKLVIDSTGDPMMTFDDLQDIKNKLKIDRARSVEVRSLYGPLLPPGWEWDDLPNKYAAPVSAFSVDRSSFELWTERGKLFFLPRSYGAKVVHKRDEGDLHVRFDPWSMVAHVSGKLPRERTRLDTLAMRNPDLAAASIFGRDPKRVNRVPQTMPTLIHRGMTLAEMLIDSLPSSDNNVSENLLIMSAKTADREKDVYGAAQASGEAMLFSGEMGDIQEGELKIADGSGLSRHNVITPRALAKLLVWADRQPTKELWHSCQARPGEEGTLKNRLAGVPFEGKTGTMDKVSALSGYVHLNGGRDLIVVILINGYICSTAETRDLMDQFIKNVLAAGNEGTLFAESNNYAGTRPYSRTGRAAHYRIR
jgi:serine-type D-Ala-D-Ala carboxypeptidase/endopeptidase (penicillin-binding protein 4)